MVIHTSSPRSKAAVISNITFCSAARELTTMPVWQQLVADFPFLNRTVSGKARDLGPYEHSGVTTAVKAISSTTSDHAIRKVLHDGRLVIVKDNQRYNALGMPLP